MMNEVLSVFSSFPKPIALVLLTLVPVFEMRVAIPVGLFAWNMSWYEVYALTLLGEMLIIAPFFYGVEGLLKLLFYVWPRLGRALEAWIGRAKQRVHGKYELYGAWSLFAFTAIPLPLTGVYSAAAAAAVLRIPFKKAFVTIALGAGASGLIISGVLLLGERFIG